MSEQLASKYAEVEKIKNKFLSKVVHLSQEQLNKVPENGGWSAAQVLYHCAYAESGTLLVIHKNLDENKVNSKSDIGSVFRNILLVISLKLPLKFKAPKAVSKVPEEISFEEIKIYFENNSLKFKKLLFDLPEALEDKFIFKHPRAGMFNIIQTINFTREHYLHHEKQLEDLL